MVVVVRERKSDGGYVYIWVCEYDIMRSRKLLWGKEEK